MTESEAIELFKERFTLIKEHYAGEVRDYEEALENGIKALEEVQQYRAISTPEECRAAVKRNSEKTRIIDGITECCGYDFGIDAFQRELSKFCPVCGRKIERSDEE